MSLGKTDSMPLVRLDWRALALPAGLWRAALTAIAVSILLSGVLIACNVLSASFPREPIQREVRRAFAERQLQNYGWLVYNSTIGMHQFNDCLVLLEAVDDRAPLIKRALSPTISGASVGQGGGGFTVPCPPLRAFVNGERPPLLPSDHYHRYVHGNVALTAALLQITSIKSLHEWYGALSLLLPLLATALALWRLARGGVRDAGPLTLSFVALNGVLLATAFGVQYYGQSLAHFPADILLSLYLLTVIGLGARLSSLSLACGCAAAFGALTMYFEFLTGGLPMGLSMVLALACVRTLDSPQRGDWARIGANAAAFLFGFVCIYAMKQTLTGYVFGADVLAASGERLETWVSGAKIGETFHRLGFFSPVIGGGSISMATLLIASSAGAFGAGVATMGFRWRTTPIGAWGVAIAALIIPAWYLTLRLHTYAHAFMMIRIMMSFFTASYFLLAWCYRDRIAATLTKLAARWRGI
ncbi:MAG: hypothetical protein WDN76_11700 [Alphaproteobacteria bacterium]